MTSERPNVSPTARYELREVAQLLGVCKGTILRWTNENKLACGYRRISKRKVWTGADILRFWNSNA